MLALAAAAIHVAGCATVSDQPAAPREMLLFDAARQREVPVLLYGAAGNGSPRPLAIISHGYTIRNSAYSFIAEALVQQGYVVASIQHELAGDAPMANAGPIFEARMPHWRRGADNIGFVASELRRQRLADSRRKMVLVGHSNGGDMSMLFASGQPSQLAAVVSLDNRRYPLPRLRMPRVCSVRSSDQPSDEGVIPSLEEQRFHGMLISQASDLRHNDMSDRATSSQKQSMVQLILACVGR